MSLRTEEHPILLFDGVCNLCSGFVQWVIRHDKRGLFKMASLQSEAARLLLQEHGVTQAPLSSVVLIDANGVATKSTAVLKMLRHLQILTWIAIPAGWVPRVIRDAIYDFIARNRYRMFGKQESCFMPTPELRDRFLDWNESKDSSEEQFPSSFR